MDKNELEYLFKKSEIIYGSTLQKVTCIEEMAELTKVLTKTIRNGSVTSTDIENLIEEIADVNLMLEQIRFLFNIKKEEIDKCIEEKLQRLKNRIEMIVK